MTHPVISELNRLGQSIWLDHLDRRQIESGELARLRDLGVGGLTANPTIFQKAVASSDAYDVALAALLDQGLQPEAALWALLIEDIQAAADVFRPVYVATAGADGYVSIEVAAAIARSTQRTIEAARDLHERVDRPNVLIKIPGTEEGLPAIRATLAAGINVNVTLIFSVRRYAEVVEAFLTGLEDHRAAGGDISKLASVASFFVSRVDTKVDKLLDESGRAQLKGKAAVANSKLAFEMFHVLHSGARWDRLEAAGARPQRCLWASTSTKDPAYPDVLYVSELIGGPTVNTVPMPTLEALLDHLEVRPKLAEGLAEAHKLLDELRAAGVDMEEVTRELEVEGVAAFAESHEKLLAEITRKAARPEPAGVVDQAAAATFPGSDSPPWPAQSADQS
ncbi:MAG TPA: transaldolase [Solirubrobacterales bacterium]|nr:transaldolase [Solirubrobacterales bacterium]